MKYSAVHYYEIYWINDIDIRMINELFLLLMFQECSIKNEWKDIKRNAL